MEWEGYKNFGENIPDGLAFVVGEKIEWVDSAFAEMFEYGREELIGSDLSSLFPPEEFSIIIRRVEAFREGKDSFTHFETTGVLKTNKDINIDVKINKIYAGGKELIQFVVRDITSIKQAERLLIKDRNSIREYFDDSGNIMVLLNRKFVVEDVVPINSKGCNILGYPREKIIGKDWVDNFLPEGIKNKTRSVFEGLVNKGQEVFEHVDNPVLAKGGELPLSISLKETTDSYPRSFIFRIAVFLLFYFSLCFSSFAFQFEKYEWGKPLKNMELKIKEKRKELIPSDKDSELSYTDKILNEDCLVSLVFTPKTKKLASIRIVWNNRYVGNDLKKLLVKKYGKFYQPDVMSDEYRWKGSSQYDLIVLNYSYLATELFYYGGSYQEKYKEETESLAEEEIDKF